MRMLLGSPAAALATVTLFFLMSFLVRTEFETPPQTFETPTITFLRGIVDTTEPVPPRESQVRPEAEVQPPPPPRPAKKSKTTDIMLPAGPAAPTPDVDPNVRAGGAFPTPLVRIPPQYPSKALARGIEGVVIVEFDIAADGSVMNAVVIDAEPAGYFERAALNAVAQWKYRPQTRDGRPSVTRGVQVSINFTIAGE
ncbi:MAG: TonB family protein [Pseudomonadota bacterium]